MNIRQPVVKMNARAVVFSISIFQGNIIAAFCGFCVKKKLKSEECAWWPTTMERKGGETPTIENPLSMRVEKAGNDDDLMVAHSAFS